MACGGDGAIIQAFDRQRRPGRGDADRDPRIAARDAVAIVHSVLKDAAALHASDVHFEPTASCLVVRFRLDGVLQSVESLPIGIAENVVARLKVLAGLLTYRNDVPQEGRIETDPRPGGVLDRRLAVFPTIYGQRAVVRLFYDEPGLARLEQLSLSEGVRTELERIAAGNQGVLLATGPAGGGKSTTLAALLRHVVRRFPGKSVVTLEDPVERRIDGVTQVQIDAHGEMTFPTALRSLLRQDPQVLMIGEIRDAETARIVIEAGLTGHLLMSSMHSATPAAAVLRLLEMDIEPYQVTSSLAAVLNQRLVRRLCERCKHALNGGGCEPVGCDRCFGTGFAGRTLIAELVTLDGELRQAILDRADRDRLEALLDARGHTTLLHDGRRLVREGITTEGELLAAVGAA